MDANLKQTEIVHVRIARQFENARENSGQKEEIVEVGMKFGEVDKRAGRKCLTHWLLM